MEESTLLRIPSRTISDAQVTKRYHLAMMVRTTDAILAKCPDPAAKNDAHTIFTLVWNKQLANEEFDDANCRRLEEFCHFREYAVRGNDLATKHLFATLCDSVRSLTRRTYERTEEISDLLKNKYVDEFFRTRPTSRIEKYKPEETKEKRPHRDPARFDETTLHVYDGYFHYVYPALFAYEPFLRARERARETIKKEGEGASAKVEPIPIPENAGVFETFFLKYCFEEDVKKMIVSYSYLTNN